MPRKRRNVSNAFSAEPTKKQMKLDSFIGLARDKKNKETQNTLKSNAPSSSNASATNDNLCELITDKEWKDALQAEFAKTYFKKIEQFVNDAYNKEEVFPPRHLIFNALNSTSLSKVKVVILGQDPYHDNGQAHGLCFSVQKGIKTPRSLVNIYKELTKDIPGFKAPDHGYLQEWADRGILLLNATLTVQAHKANSHSKCGWTIFTDACIKVVSEKCNGVVFLLWGGFAQKKEILVDTKKHRVIKTAHPSPLSCTKFFNCACFSETNKALVQLNKEPVKWNIT